MKKRLVILAIVLAIVITGIIVFKNDDRETKYALGDIINEQKEIDKKINKEIKNKRNSFDNPKVMVNPYKLAPLTALIIFTTDESESINVTINSRFGFISEKTKNHAIPIYGLYDGEDNKVLLQNSKGEIKEVIIKTESFEGDRLKVEKTSDSLNDDLYFLSPNFVENCIYDKEGKLLWYIKGDYAGDIEFLDNGHFYISDPYQGTNGVKINYASFLEMDYLGKIYKQFITLHGYHHELYLLDDNRILTTGAKDGSDFLEAVLYIMDKNTGETLYYIDMYEYLHDIAPEWIESLGSDFDFVLNSIDYDEETKDVLLSFRGIGVITRFNLENKEIKWMFGDPKNLPKEFDKYLLKVTDKTKYPYGEHSATFTKDGNIAFHNNDADQFNMKSDKLSDYVKKYTTNVVFKVNENKKTLKTIWEYDAKKKEFSKVGGMLTFLDNGNTLINYGWSIKEEAYEKADKVSISDTNYLNGIVVELDKNNNVLFRGSTEGLIFRAYKSNFYSNNVSDFKVVDYKKIDGNTVNGKKIKTSSIKTKIKNAKEYTGEFDVLVNRMIIKTDIKDENEVKAIFVNGNEAYEYVYKNKVDKVYEGFNSGIYGVKIKVPDGKYKVYIDIDGTYYDTNINMVF